MFLIGIMLVEYATQKQGEIGKPRYHGGGKVRFLVLMGWVANRACHN